MSKLSFETPEFLKLINSPEFRKEMEKQTTKEELKKLFEKNAVKMTDEQFEEFTKAVSYANSKEDKLDDSHLENVSGGKAFGEAVGDFIHDHPYLTFFGVTSVVGSVCSIPYGIAKVITAVKSNNNN